MVGASVSACLLQLKRPPGEEGEEQEEEERCVSVVANLLLALQRGSRRDRVAAKFVENEFEKCDRLAEIYLRMAARIRAEEVTPHVADPQTCMCLDFALANPRAKVLAIGSLLKAYLLASRCDLNVPAMFHH